MGDASQAGAAMSESQIVLPHLQPLEIGMLWAVLATAIIALLYGWHLTRKVMRASPGSDAMQSVGAAIHDGAMAYLGRQFRTMIWLILAITIGLYFLYLGKYAEDRMIPLGIALSFLMGVFASYGAGYVGMGLAVRANVRVANAALGSFKRALELAFQAGTVSGMFTVGLGLLGATVIFLAFKENAMRVLVGFGFGGSLAALFMRVGGGIFTKAADVGADLVGKVEKGIPEDDPRNAAVIADNVGDNVGDCAGMAADVFESYEVTLVAAIILGAAAIFLGKDMGFGLKLIIYPLLVRAVGVFASIAGTWFVRGRDDESMNPMQPINIGFWVSALLAAVGFGVATLFYLPDWRFFFATLMGIVLALIIGRLTEHFTATDKGPVTEIARATRTGAATMLLAGLAEGMESSVWAILAICLTMLGSFVIFGGNLALAFYGVALAGLGLLTTTAYILAMDTFGPISDNANGIFEMSGALKEGDSENVAAHRIVARLDAVGNTTKALTKGFAIATAVLAATALFASFAAEGGLAGGIPVDYPPVFIGLLIGGAVPFLFSSFAIRAVGRAASLLVEEVRRQFREIPGIMEGTGRPDYSRCVAISTAAAQKELIGPGLLAIATPIAVAFGLGPAALGGYLAGAILTGQLLAVFMANTGGAWDNAKKKIEDGLYGGKGSDNHKAAVIGDTVGDPLKDTAGPALNPLIKVMNLVAILIAPFVAVGQLETMNLAGRALVVAAAIAALAVAVGFSKRSGVTAEPSPGEGGDASG
ncbi:MAG TPA: sodium-translocating pyrophosphatase [Armatimonadota bacterium]|nr:sodium-translocating pyrophosphatase [Armatimonadota bacterium]